MFRSRVWRLKSRCTRTLSDPTYQGTIGNLKSLWYVNREEPIGCVALRSDVLSIFHQTGLDENRSTVGKNKSISTKPHEHLTGYFLNAYTWLELY